MPPLTMLVEDPASCALLLDLDGTLIDIAPEPHLVVIPPDLVSLLSRRSGRLNGALAIITGRTIKEIDHFLHALRLRVAGVHGAEMRSEVGGDMLSCRFSAIILSSLISAASKTLIATRAANGVPFG